MGHCECGEEAIVGVGSDATPLCLTHFQEYLDGARTVIDKMREATRPKGRDDG